MESLVLQLDEMKKKYNDTKTAYTVLLKINAQKDLELATLKQSVQVAKNLPTEKFSLEEFKDSFTEEELIVLENISSHKRHDHMFVKVLLEYIYKNVQ